MARSVNKVILVGNLTRDPEMRYIPSGQPVASFGVATNRRWTSKTDEQKEETEFHNLVAWGKLAELCTQLLKKGRKVYLEGRLQTRSWEGKDGVTRQRTEIVLEDMVVLDRPPQAGGEKAGGEKEESVAPAETPVEESSPAETPEKEGKASGDKDKKDEEIDESEIPF